MRPALPGIFPYETLHKHQELTLRTINGGRHALAWLVSNGRSGPQTILDKALRKGHPEQDTFLENSTQPIIDPTAARSGSSPPGLVQIFGRSVRSIFS